MKYLLFLTEILLKELSKKLFLLKSLAFSFFYITLTISILNYKTFLNFITADYPLFAKLNILWLLFFGSFSAISRLDLTMLLIVALLFGLNIELVLAKLGFLKKTGSLKIAFGSGFVTLISAGCASCGLSLASLIGITGAIAVLPFGGLELYILSIIILLTSLYYNLHTLVKVCKLK